MMIQIAAAFIGSLGFAVFLKMKGKQALMAGVGGGLTWALFLALQNYMGDCSCRIFWPPYLWAYTQKSWHA